MRFFGKSKGLPRRNKKLLFMKTLLVKIRSKKDEEYVLSHLDALKIQNLIVYQEYEGESDGQKTDQKDTNQGFDKEAFLQKYQSVKEQIKAEKKD